MRGRAPSPPRRGGGGAVDYAPSPPHLLGSRSLRGEFRSASYVSRPLRRWRGHRGIVTPAEVGRSPPCLARRRHLHADGRPPSTRRHLRTLDVDSTVPMPARCRSATSLGLGRPPRGVTLTARCRRHPPPLRHAGGRVAAPRRLALRRPWPLPLRGGRRGCAWRTRARRQRAACRGGLGRWASGGALALPQRRRRPRLRADIEIRCWRALRHRRPGCAAAGAQPSAHRGRAGGLSADRHPGPGRVPAFAQPQRRSRAVLYVDHAAT